jgi:hypothetical protein
VIGDAVERDAGAGDRPEGDHFGRADEDVGHGVELLGVDLALPARQLAQQLGDQVGLLGADRRRGGSAAAARWPPPART